MEIKRNSKTILIIAICIITFIGLSFITYAYLNATSYHFVKYKCENYLSQKYDVDKSEFELIDYRQAKFYLYEKSFLSFGITWSDFAFQYKYNGRTFIVNRFDGDFFDDYQLEDVEKWCTEWLQKNIDERIVGVSIFSYDLRYNKNAIFTKKDIESFLSSRAIDLCFYVYFDCIDYDSYNTIESIEDELKTKFKISEEIDVEPIFKHNIIKKEYKVNEGRWYYYY